MRAILVMSHQGTLYPNRTVWPKRLQEVWNEHFAFAQEDREKKAVRLAELHSWVRARTQEGTNRGVLQLPLHLSFEALRCLGNGAPRIDNESRRR